MMMPLRPYPDGMDCVWLASDGVGCLGVFITAGIGPIPVAALDINVLPIEEVESGLYDLPQITQAKLLVSVKRPDDFINLAERGFFVYDWTDVGRTVRDALHVYEPVAAPVQPMRVGALPEELATLAKAVQLFGVGFVGGNVIDIRRHVSCAESE